jgi:hypothetical protein
MRRRLRCVFALVFLISLAVYPAQIPAPGQFRIVVPEELKKRQTHHPHEKYPQAILITVVDELDRPVPLASVTFETTPASGGAGALTSTGGVKFQTTTGEKGIAMLPDLRANQYEGEYDLRVEATFYDKRADAQIPEINKKPPFAKRKTTWAIAIAAAAIVIPIVVLHKPTPTATISTVTPTGPVTHP